MKRWSFSLAAACLLFPEGHAAAATAIVRTEPRLVVLVSVDGLSWPRLEAYRPWFVAGFKRLLDESQVETRCRYRHLNTETGPGHSSLSTGAPPRVTGIVANRWFERSIDGSIRDVGCAAQPNPAYVPYSPALLQGDREGRTGLRVCIEAGAGGLAAVGGGRTGRHSARLRVEGRDRRLRR